MPERVIIIGNGIAGITAARNIRKLSDDTSITVISSESKFFYSRTALMYIYMGHMKYEHTKPYEDWFWRKNRINLIQDRVTAINTTEKEIILKSGEKKVYDKLLIATGSKPNKFGWPGQDLMGVQGLYDLDDLQVMEENTRGIEKAVIVGGGLIGVEMAEMLRSRNIEVTFLVREDAFWNNVLPLPEAKMISNHIEKHGVQLLLKTELKEILSDEKGKVKGVITSENEEISCQFVGLTTGVKPNIEFLMDSGIDIDKGILVDSCLRTNIPEIFAAGDCAQHRNPPEGRKPIEQVWYTGRIMGEMVAHNILGSEKTYNPGTWFNSAKFFDIEYQTYGYVPNIIPENLDDFYWQHSHEEKCMHFIFSKENREFLGVNSFGIRIRGDNFISWIEEGRSIEYVISHLRDANFDPEFSNNYEIEIGKSFMKNYPDSDIKPVKKKTFLNLFN